MTAVWATIFALNRPTRGQQITNDNVALSFVLLFKERMAHFSAQKPKKDTQRPSGLPYSTAAGDNDPDAQVSAEPSVG